MPNGAHTAVDVVLDTAYQGIDQNGWSQLFETARKAKLSEFISDMFAGKHINQSENRPALHSASQKPLSSSMARTSCQM